MLPGDPAIRRAWCRRGDVIVVPQGETHVLGSSIDLVPEVLAPLLANQVETKPGEVIASPAPAVEAAGHSHGVRLSRAARRSATSVALRVAETVQGEHARIRRVVARIVAAVCNRGGSLGAGG